MPENDRAVQSAARRPPPEAEPIHLAILYEDEWLMAIDKPPGMVVHPTYRNWSGTLLNGLLWHLRHAPGPQGPGLQHHTRAEVPGLQPRIVTRLDKDTSGVVLVALTADIHARIQRDIDARRVKKEYLAVVHGVPAPPRGTIALPLARSVFDRRRVVVDPCGQESETRYEVMGRPEGRPLHDANKPTHDHDTLSLVRCELVTGRTHQIRVHLTARGWPIVGDRVYGTPPYDRMARQALHAWRVTLPHPWSGQPLEIEAPVPSDLRALTGQPSETDGPHDLD